MQKYIKIQYLYLFFIIVWTPINFAIGVDGMGRLKMLASFITVVMLSVNFGQKYIVSFKDKSVIILIALVGYMVINYLYLFIPSVPPPPAERLVKICSLIYPLIVLSIVVMEICQGRANKIFTVLLFAYYCWILALLFFTRGGIGTESRLSIEGIDSNDFAFVACLILFLLYIKCHRYGMTFNRALLLSIIPVALLIIAASRTAFAIFLMIMAIIFVDQIKNLDAKKLLIGITMLIVGGGGYMYVMENTTLGERLEKTSEQSENKDLKTGTFVDAMGDRGPFYFFGFLEFQKEPIHGIGLTNFGKKAVWGWYRHSLVLHSEYMVQLCECGIIGFTLFMAFLYSLWSRIRQASYRYLNVPKIVLYGALFTTMFIALFFWTYDRFYIFILYGIIIGYTRLCKNKKMKLNKQINCYNESAF